MGKLKDETPLAALVAKIMGQSSAAAMALAEKSRLEKEGKTVVITSNGDSWEVLVKREINHG